jgi:hypothetical protein
LSGFAVMAGFVQAIASDCEIVEKKDVDAGHKAGHDELDGLRFS